MFKETVTKVKYTVQKPAFIDILCILYALTAVYYPLLYVISTFFNVLFSHWMYSYSFQNTVEMHLIKLEIFTLKSEIHSLKLLIVVNHGPCFSVSVKLTHTVCKQTTCV